MRILTIADVESPYYYEYYSPGKLDEFDLILACGDMRKEYLEFLITLGRCPLVYVHGNHDDAYRKDPPLGCVCAEDRIYVHQGIRILGLGGSCRYRNGEHMFTERQMRARIRRLWLQLRRHQGFDILLTHAPARHINDFDSLTHRGFACFVDLLDRYQPSFFVHGHIHKNYGVNIPQRTVRGRTTIINAYDHCVFDYETRI